MYPIDVDRVLEEEREKAIISGFSDDYINERLDLTRHGINLINTIFEIGKIGGDFPDDIAKELGKIIKDTHDVAPVLLSFQAFDAFEAGRLQRKKRFVIFGRSQKDGGIEFYISDQDTPPRKVDDLIIQSTPLECGSDIYRALVNHIETQIKYNSIFQTPIAINDVFAVTLSEANSILNSLIEIETMDFNQGGDAHGDND